MVMPAHVHVTRFTDLDSETGQTEGMARKGAIINKSDKICASVMIAKPHTSSAIHHHGEQDTIVYASTGYGAIISENGQKRQELAPGDFAFIPAWTEHQEVNDSEGDVTWVITRSGGSPVVVNLKGWGDGER